MKRDLSAIDRDIGQDWSRIIQEAFEHGIDCDIIHGGLLEGKSEQDIYKASATQNYVVGTRRVTPEGRVYKYGKATAEIGHMGSGLKFWSLLSDGIGWQAPKKIQTTSDSTIWLDSGKAAGVVTKDELVGGYIIIHTGTVSNDMVRRIIANTLADGDGFVTIRVDRPWDHAIATDFGTETYPNPYMNLRQRIAAGSYPTMGDRLSSVAGMPTVRTTVADMFLWIQTWGPCWVTPGANLGANVADDRRGCFFDYEGKIIEKTAAAASTDIQQYAGFIINREDTSTGPPLFMLQISP